MNQFITQVKEEESNSCGIKKIIDCKLMNGQQMYKVKWEPTWEPAQNLETCQHLINEFWSHVNKVKVNEHVAEKYCKKIRLETNGAIMNNNNIHRLSEDSKEDIQRLISQTNNTPTVTNSLVSPSNMLMSFEEQMKQKEFHDQKQDIKKVGKLGSDLTSSPNKMGMSSLKYLENFDNPYVKAIVVCKICNKEQSLKFVSNWRPHFLTHSDQKPHQCPHCPKGFLRPDRLRNHISQKHGGDGNNASGGGRGNVNNGGNGGNSLPQSIAAPNMPNMSFFKQEESF